MSFLKVPLHNAEVTGVRMDRQKQLLQLDLVLHTGEAVWLDFQNAEAWSLSGLGARNVLLDIREWRAGMAGTAERCAERKLEASWTQKVLAGEFALYEVAPSVGLGGYIVARAVTMARAWEESSQQGVAIEIDHLLQEGWTRTMDAGNFIVTGPAGPKFINEVWRIANFITYGHYMSLERLERQGEPERTYRLLSRADQGVGFQVTFRAVDERQ